MDDRRVADEQFRRELAERMKAVEIGLHDVKEESHEVKQEILKLKMAQLDLHYTLFGGPKADDAGLLEKFRHLLYRFGLVILIAVGVIGFAGKLISPLYTKWVTDFLYNSVSEKWMREHSQPKITHYHITQKMSPDNEKD